MTPAELKAARKALGLSLAGLAAATGRSKRTLRRWEDGTADVPDRLRDAVHELLDAPTTTESTPPETHPPLPRHCKPAEPARQSRGSGHQTDAT